VGNTKVHVTEIDITVCSTKECK